MSWLADKLATYDREQLSRLPLSQCPPGASGVLTERNDNGRRITLETEEQVWNDAVDQGLVLTDMNRWLAHVEANTHTKYTFPPHVNSIDFVKIKNQGPIGSCLGVSLSSVATWLYYIKTGKIKLFSGFFNYLKCQQPDGLLGRDTGSVPSTGYRIAQQFGFVPDEYLATRLPKGAIQAWGGTYPPNYGQGLRAYKPLLNDPEIAKVASQYRVETIAVVKDVDQIVDGVASGTVAISQCSKWTPPFDAPGHHVQGQFEGRSRRGMHGHHAYYLSGYNESRQCNLTNSWGLQYGDEGGKSIDRGTHQQCLDHKDTHCVAMSDMTVEDNRQRPFKWKASNWA